MLTLRKPTQDDVSRFLARQAVADFSYRELECTRGTAPAAWYCDRYRAHLGNSVETFARAREAVLAWSMFRLGWVEAHPATSDVTPGANVAVLVRACGAWWLNGARIVYVHDSPTDDRQFGFAYGTLQDHAECGEERFWVVRDHEDELWFELTAMSHPAKWFVRAGLPLVRRLQRRFAADAQRAMQREVGGA
jgi:uncharacterized protein (UPF0548 family)